MTYSNADGQRAALCLNGTRCAARLAFHLDWATGRTIVATDAGDYRATNASENTIELEMPRPEAPGRALDLVVGEESWQATPITVGVPHLVLLWEASMAEAPVAQLGPPLRAHSEFGQAGTNVDFVRFPSPNRLEIRSFERGVEAETLACGTGVLAAVAVGLELELAKLPVTALTLGGFEIEVDQAGWPEHWAMTGDARLVALGELTPAATVRPQPPEWT
jgi:diaminopimelate epimerase